MEFRYLNVSVCFDYRYVKVCELFTETGRYDIRLTLDPQPSEAVGGFLLDTSVRCVIYSLWFQEEKKRNNGKNDVSLYYM